MKRKTKAAWADFAKSAVTVVFVIGLAFALFSAVFFGLKALNDGDARRAHEKCVDDAIQTLVYTGELAYVDAVELVAEHEDVLCS